MTTVAGLRERAAKDFLMLGIQEWGQPDTERARATANYLTEAGFQVEASGYPIFGGMFPQQPIKGPDGEAAFKWLKDVLDKLQRGKFQTEVAQLTAALQPPE